MLNGAAARRPATTRRSRWPSTSAARWRGSSSVMNARPARWACAARASPRPTASSTRATTPAPPTSPRWRARSSTSPGWPGSSGAARAILPFPIKGGQALPLQPQPAAAPRLPGGDRGQDRASPTPAGRCLVAAASAPRPAARRGAAALARHRPPGDASCSTAASGRALTAGPGRTEPDSASHRYSPGSGSQRHARTGRVPRRGARLARGSNKAPAPAPRRRAPTRGQPSTSRRAARGRASSPRAASPASPGRRSSAARATGPIEQVIVNQEIGRAGVPGILDVIGDRHARAVHHRPRHRRAEGPLPRPDAPRRRGLVPAVLRAGRRLGPRRGADPRQAPDDDGGWTLNGQKVWTTNAQFAAYGLLLARTDPDVPKHKGLTMFIVPMDAEGVTIRGLRQISGEAEFNEVFFDDVKLDAEHVVGGVGNGWGTALTVADVRAPDDRPGLRGLRLPRRPLRRGDRGRRHRRAPRQRRPPAASATLATELLAIRFTGYRTLTALSQGPDPRPGGGPGEGHDRQRGDRRRRPDRRRARPRRAGRATASGAT